MRSNYKYHFILFQMVNSSFTEDGNPGEKIPPDWRDATSHSVTSIEKQEEENSSDVGAGLQPPRLDLIVQ